MECNIAVIDQLGGDTTSLAKFHEMDVRERTENQNEWKNVQNTVPDGRWRYSSLRSRGYLEVR